MRKALIQNNDTVRIVHTVDGALRIVSRNETSRMKKRRDFLTLFDLCVLPAIVRAHFLR